MIDYTNGYEKDLKPMDWIIIGLAALKETILVENFKEMIFERKQAV